MLTSWQVPAATRAGAPGTRPDALTVVGHGTSIHENRPVPRGSTPADVDTITSGFKAMLAGGAGRGGTCSAARPPRPPVGGRSVPIRVASAACREQPGSGRPSAGACWAGENFTWRRGLTGRVCHYQFIRTNRPWSLRAMSRLRADKLGHTGGDAPPTRPPGRAAHCLCGPTLGAAVLLPHRR